MNAGNVVEAAVNGGVWVGDDIPAATASAEARSSIGHWRIAPIVAGQLSHQVRRQRHRQAAAHLVKRPGTLDLSCQPRIAFIAIDNRPRRALLRRLR